MEMEGLREVVPPSDRVSGLRLLAASILKRQRRRYREEIGKKTSILGIYSAGVIYRRRGGQEGGPPGSHAPPGAAIPRARHQGTWVPGGGPLCNSPEIPPQLKFLFIASL